MNWKPKEYNFQNKMFINIVLIDETREGVNFKLEWWEDTLETKGFRLSR